MRRGNAVSGVWGVLLGLAARAVVGETIYATNGAMLWSFDSDSPGTVAFAAELPEEFELLSGTSLETDPSSGALYSFSTQECNILCPPLPVVVRRLDPLTGTASATGWPDLPGGADDKSVHPGTRELRLLDASGGNWKLTLSTFELVEESPLDLPGYYPALAHAPAVAGGGEITTYAIRTPDFFSYDLVRLGGPGGDPPASSGEVTTIGALALDGALGGFDVGADGTAYLAVSDLAAVGGAALTRLFTVDLGTAALTEVGAIAGSEDGPVTGIAVASSGLGAPVLAIPTLSPVALAGLVVVLAMAAVSLLARRRHFARRD